MRSIFHLYAKNLILYVTLTSLLMIISCNKELKDAPSISLTSSNAVTLPGGGTKTNIILFLADDVGYEVPTYTGGKTYSTPNLDMMAAGGIFFKHAFSHPDGYPSRLALFSGKYNFRNYTNWGHFPASEKSLSNMLHNAGYKTCYVGKWQMGGGDAEVHRQGYDRYSAFQVNNGDGQRIGRYKNPIVFQDGAYLPDKQTKGKYSEDIFSDYLCNFIDSNKNKPFFCTYAFNLAAAPYTPTPDDPEFANWNTDKEINHDNPKWFPNMIKYMDKMVGKVLAKVKADGLENNTIIMFIADNATQKSIKSVWGPTNMVLEGQKTRTNIWGTLTPLIAYCPGKIAPKRNNKTLIDYTDFLPTFADIAGIATPKTYGTLDGISFYDDLVGKAGTDRSWVFTHWDGDKFDTIPRVRFVNDLNYKLYDTLNYSRFYNILKDTFERSPIPNSKLTPEEKTIKSQFIEVLQSMH